jgi:hypothetical protein
MNRLASLGGLACLVLAGCGPSVGMGSAPSAPASRLAVDGDVPVVAHDDLDATWLLSGAAVTTSDAHHLFPLVWLTDDDQHPRILHLTSSDARTWRAAPDAVVPEAGELELAWPGPVPSSVLVEPDGGWAMYGSGRLAGSERPVAWRAVADVPGGPWRLGDLAVLQPGDAAAWDGRQLDHPSVVVHGDGYLMAYGGASYADRNAGGIGFASSPDGITWTRTDAEPLLPGACDVPSRSLTEPHLAIEGDRLVLLFGAMEVDGDRMVVLRATSDDGVGWRCDAANPVLTPDDFPPSEGLHSMVALEVDGAPALLVETLGDGASDLWLATVSEGG